MPDFAMIPFEAISDKRLSLRDMRVLAAISSRTDRRGHIIKREQISIDAGIHVSHVSISTTKLVEYGWLIRSDKAHKGTAKHYRVNFKNKQQRVAKPDTQSGPKNPPPNPAESVAEPATLQSVAEPATQLDPKGSQLGVGKGSQLGVPTPYIQTIEQTTNSAASIVTTSRAQILAALSALNFRHENVHTPTMMGTIDRWCENGITADEVIDVTTTLRTRYPNKEFGPSYIDKPLAEYHQAKEKHNGHETHQHPDPGKTGDWGSLPAAARNHAVTEYLDNKLKQELKQELTAEQLGDGAVLGDEDDLREPMDQPMGIRH